MASGRQYCAPSFGTLFPSYPASGNFQLNARRLRLFQRRARTGIREIRNPGHHQPYQRPESLFAARKPRSVQAGHYCSPWKKFLPPSGLPIAGALRLQLDWQ